MLRKINVTGLEIGYVILTSFSSLELGLGALRPLATPVGLRSRAFSPSAFLLTALHSWALSQIFPFGTFRMILCTISIFSASYPEF